MGSEREKRIIVSLTSYPKRIHAVSEVVRTMCAQTYRADKIVLYLAREQFEDGILPKELEQFSEYGFEIHWCDEDLGSHKKYYYAFREYPDDIIITVDDDFCFSKNMIEELIIYHKKYPECVITRRAHLITADDESGRGIAPYLEWDLLSFKYIGIPRMDLFATGGGGVLYPPRIFPEEVLNKDHIIKYCFYADDIWLKVMEVLAAVPVVQAVPFFVDKPMPEYANDGLFQRQNAGRGNDEQLENLLNIYDKFNGGEGLLIKRIFSDGKILYSDKGKSRYSDLIRIEKALLQKQLEDKNAVIYGIEKEAEIYYESIKRHELQDRIKAFVTSSINKETPQRLFQIPVKQYTDYIDSGISYIIAVSDECRDKIINDLLESGISKSRIIEINDYLKRAAYLLRNTKEYRRRPRELWRRAKRKLLRICGRTDGLKND